METRCFGCMQLKEKHPICEHCGYDETHNNSDHQLPVGTVVGGQYVLGRVLGQGGFGITYLGWDRIMGRPVAVKEYFPKGYASRTNRNTRVTNYDGQNVRDFEYNKRRFCREAEALATLWDVPQIIKILRHFEENGTAYIAMEYAQGINLRDYLKKLGRPLTVEETMFFLRPIMKALKAIHSKDLVHRDIAPDNIMVEPNGSTKLLDFGAARYVENADAEKERPSSTQAILKAGFAPPEQYQSHGALGPWTDEYAMCATIYFCLTGNVLPEAMSRILEGKEIDWDRVRGFHGRQLEALKKGLSIVPKDRFATVEELWRELEPVPERVEKPEKGAPKEPSEKQTESAGKESSGTRKRKPAVIAAAVLAVTVGLAAFVQRLQNKPEVEYLYEENATGLTITGYVGTLPAQLNIPGEHNGKDVTIIGASAFEDSAEVVSVIIPHSVTSVGNLAFMGCTSLTSITIPDSVTFIGARAFSDCINLGSITIPDGVTYIMDSTFDGCLSLTAISIPDSVTSIGYSAFMDCTSLASITIPDSVMSIGGEAFRNCTSLASITIPDSVTSIGDLAFMDCTSLTSITIPDGVTFIMDSAFKGCQSLTVISIPDSIISIGHSAFMGCISLNRITIPDSVSFLGDCAFLGCENLRYAQVPEKLKNNVQNAGFPDTCIIRYYYPLIPSDTPEDVSDIEVEDWAYTVEASSEKTSSSHVD